MSSSSSSASHLALVTLIGLSSFVNCQSSDTVAPTATPTYGPASDEVVNIIFVSVIGGIIVVLLFYFWTGWMLYERDVEQRMLRAEATGSGDFLPGNPRTKSLYPYNKLMKGLATVSASNSNSNPSISRCCIFKIYFPVLQIVN